MAMAKKNWMLVVVAGSLIFVGCLNNKKTAALKSQQRNRARLPSRTKFCDQKATNDIQHSRYEEARLSLQTLINTYPDSEYLRQGEASPSGIPTTSRAASLVSTQGASPSIRTSSPSFPSSTKPLMRKCKLAWRIIAEWKSPIATAMRRPRPKAPCRLSCKNIPTARFTAQVRTASARRQEILADGDFRVASFYYLRHVDFARPPHASMNW